MKQIGTAKYDKMDQTYNFQKWKGVDYMWCCEIDGKLLILVQLEIRLQSISRKTSDFLLRIILKFLKSTAISKFVLYVWHTILCDCACRDNYIKITIPMAI